MSNTVSRGFVQRPVAACPILAAGTLLPCALLVTTEAAYAQMVEQVVEQPVDQSVTSDEAAEAAPAGPVRVAAAAGPRSQDGETLATVVVTARNREEKLQDVPLSVSVVGGEQLQRLEAVDLSSFATRVANVFVQRENPQHRAASIRGIGMMSNTHAQDPSVGIIVDGVNYAYNPLAASVEYTDVQSLEVTRGPQGTLMGKNATLGVINVITRRPSFTPDASFSVGFGDNNTLIGRAAGGGPLIDDVLAWRGSVSVQRGAEHGVVIGNEALMSKIPAPAAEGIIGMDYLRLALERARSVDEAVHVITTLLREHGQSGNCAQHLDLTYHNSFIIADANSAKVLETVEREWALREVEDYYAISNTMSIEGEFQSSSASLQARAVEAGLYESGEPFSFKSVYEDADRVASGCWRHARATKLLAAGNGRLEQTDFFSILRDHEEGARLPGRPSGPRICAHTRESPIGQTTASWVADLTPGKTIHWVTATSAPCTGLFKPVIFECGLPEHGPKPDEHEDQASLWWRHEQLCRGLDRASQDLRAAYIAERDRLEAHFLTEMANCPAVTDDATRAAAAGSWRNVGRKRSRSKRAGTSGWCPRPHSRRAGNRVRRTGRPFPPVG